MSSDSQADRQAGYLACRSSYISLLQAGINSRQDSRLFLEKAVEEIISIRNGPLDNLASLCQSLVQELSMYAVLCSCCLVYACDACYAEGWTAQREFTGYRRRHGEQLADTIANVERLYLNSLGMSDLERSSIYTAEFGTSHAGAVLAVHEQVVTAIAGGGQSYAKIIADEFSIAAHNARALAVTKAGSEEGDRCAILSATSIAFSANLIGKDRHLSDLHANKIQDSNSTKQLSYDQYTKNLESREPRQTETRELTRTEKRSRDRYVAAVTRSGYANREADDSQTRERFGRNQPGQENRFSSGAENRVRQGGAPNPGAESRFNSGTEGRNPRPNATEGATQYRIDWAKIQEAGTGPKGPLRDLATQIFPNDACTDYAIDLQNAGFPKPMVTMLAEDGNTPRLRPDRSIDQRYLQGRTPDGKGDPACRHCNVWLHPKNSRADQAEVAKLSAEQKCGSHNPKKCFQSIAHLKASPHGMHFLEDRSRGRYK